MQRWRSAHELLASADDDIGREPTRIEIPLVIDKGSRHRSSQGVLWRPEPHDTPATARMPPEAKRRRD